MPSGRQHRGKVLIGHVVLPSHPRQDPQDAPLGEFGTFGGPGHQVNHLGEATPVGVPAPAMAGAEPTSAATAKSTTAHARLPGETEAMILHHANCCPAVGPAGGWRIVKAWRVRGHSEAHCLCNVRGLRSLAKLPDWWRQDAAHTSRERRVQPPRTWRTRPDPFEGVWCDALSWLQEDPDASAVVLLGRLQEAEPDRFSRAHLRTLQRRVQQWRGIMAKKLVYATAGEPMAGPAAMPELALVGRDARC